MSSKLPVLLAAAFGGISPNILRLGLSLMNEGAELPEFTYLLGLLIFAVMGGAVALIWQETDVKKAFYLGVGLPALIQMSAGEITNRGETAMTEIGYRQPAVAQQPGPAFAIRPAVRRQDPPAQPPATAARRLEIKSTRYIPRLAVIFLSADSSVIIQKTIRPRERQLSHKLDIPEFATAFRVQVNQSVSETRPLPDKLKNIQYEIDPQKSAWSGLLEAFGFRSAAMEIQIREMKEAENPQQ